MAIVVAPWSKATRSGSMTSVVRPGVRDRDGDVTGPQLHGVRHGQVRVRVRVRDQADAQQLLDEVLADEVGGPDAVHIDAAGTGERGDGGFELGDVQRRGRVGQALLLVLRQLRDDIDEGVVDRYVGGHRGGAAGRLLRGERGEGEAQIAVARVAEQPGGPHDGGLAGAGALREAGDGEGGAAGRVARDGLGDPLHGAGHRRREGADLGGQCGGGGWGRGRSGLDGRVA